MDVSRNSEQDIERLLRDHAPDVQAVVQRLRELILAAVPEASERANPGWHSLNYRHPRHGYFCGIFPEREGVRLVFEYGVLLSDPHAILQGDGKQVRFILLTAGQELPVDALQSYIMAALDLPAKKSEKMALIRTSIHWDDRSG